MKKYILLVVIHGQRSYELFDDEKEAVITAVYIGNTNHCDELAVTKLENENWLSIRDVEQAVKELFNSLLESGTFLFHWKRVE